MQADVLDPLLSPLVGVTAGPALVQMVNASLNASLEVDDYEDFSASKADKCFPDARSMNFSGYESSARHDILPEIGAEEIIKILSYTLIIIVSLVGNSMVILVVLTNVKMRTTENLYLANLAVADLLVTIFCSWVHLVKHLTYPHYVLSEVFCKLEGTIALSALASSVFTLTAISIGRLAAILFPYRSITRKGHVGKVVLLLWIISLALGLPSAMHRDLYSKEFTDQTMWHCDEFWDKGGYYDESDNKCVTTYHAQEYFHGCLAIALYFVPVFVMLLSYGLMLWRLRQRAPGDSRHHPSRERAHRKVRLAVTIVVVAFVICWTPLQSMVLFASFSKIYSGVDSIPWFKHVEFAAYFIAFSNSALNPIIYCSFSYSFRQGFKTLLGYSRTNKKGFFSRHAATWRTLTGKTKETNLPNGEDEAMLAPQDSPANHNSLKKTIVVEAVDKKLCTRALSKEEEQLIKNTLPKKIDTCNGEAKPAQEKFDEPSEGSN